jgi:hypothetical protein
MPITERAQFATVIATQPVATERDDRVLVLGFARDFKTRRQCLGLVEMRITAFRVRCSLFDARSQDRVLHLRLIETGGWLGLLAASAVRFGTQ